MDVTRVTQYKPNFFTFIINLLKKYADFARLRLRIIAIRVRNLKIMYFRNVHTIAFSF